MIRWAVRLVAAALALLVVYVGVTFVQVWWASNQDDTSPASAIVVMGAAQWNGRPSPVLQGRLDHAVELYEQGAAPVIVVTGGMQAGDSVSQGFSGLTYLRDQGVPEEAIRVETEGTNSYEELSASALILRSEGLGQDVLVVSDPYHAMRVTQIAGEVGLDAHVSPTDAPSSLRDLGRETAAVALGRIVGYRRLASWV